jgi:dienelactone hydrolase
MRAAVVFLGLIAGLIANFGANAAEPTVEIPSRNQKIRAILLKPEKPIASVILLVGGHGKMDIAANGDIKWGRGNQLIRTRAEYRKQGFAVLVPDIAQDWKTPAGVVNGYRWHPRLGQDLGALVAYMRTIAEPVVVVGTSRAAVSAGAMLLVAEGKSRPDYVVLTAAMLMPSGNQPSFLRAIQNNKEKAQVPMFLIGHKKDQCEYTLPESIDAFRKWRGDDKLDVLLLDGPQGTGHQCEAQAAHGFIGIDDQVVKAVSEWIKSRR